MTNPLSSAGSAGPAALDLRRSTPTGGTSILPQNDPPATWSGWVRAWLRASRLASQSYIALPLVLGQLVATQVTGRALDLGTLVLVQLFGVFDQLYIAYANDVADQATDRENRTSTPFSGGSRALVTGGLTPRALGFAALVCALVFVAISGGLALERDAPWLLVFALAAILLLQAYSFEPLRLSYRGGGELLQMLGVGLVLPLYGFVAQGAPLASFPWATLALLLPTHLACAIATALPDEPSDRASSKRTLAVRLGGERAALVVVALNGAAIVLAPIAFAAVGASPGLWLALPMGATFVVLLAAPAAPGSRAMFVRVAAAIACTLALVGLLVCELAFR